MRDDEKGGKTLPAGSGLAEEPVSGFDATIAPEMANTIASAEDTKPPTVKLAGAIGSAVAHARLAAASAVAGIEQPSAFDTRPSDAVTELPLVDPKNYTMLEEYARGGLGRIVRAKDERTGRIVAIKEMLGNEQEIATRFAREARVTANLQHPAIVPVYELGRWPSGAPFYAMKLVAGRSFQQTIAATTSLEERLARLSIVTAVAEALAYAHEQGVIHRDLKPANVLVGDFGETVVIDWGLAKVIGVTERASMIQLDTEGRGTDATVVGSVLGTPSYMPPEQAAGGEADARADVYAIGAMLYQLITGVAPFADRSPKDLGQLLAMVENQPPTPVATLEPAAPPDLVTIIAKAMARDRTGRYPSAAELAADLRRFTNGQLVQAHHYDRVTLIKRWLRRNRAAVTVGTALATVLVVGGVFSVKRILDERDTAERNEAAAVKSGAEAEAQAANARESLALALFQKGRNAEQQQRWRDAVVYYAAARTHADSPRARWAAGLAEARAIVPHTKHEGHTDVVTAAAISRDGTRVVTVDAAGDARMWRRKDGSLLALAKLAEPLSAVAFAPDGSSVAVAGESGTIVTFTTKHGGSLVRHGELKGHGKRVWSLAYAPDAGRLASAGEDGTVRLWSLGDGSAKVLAGHTQRVYSVAFSPDGTRLASVGDDRALWLWTVATGAGTHRGSHRNGGIRVVAWTGNGEHLLTAGWDFAMQLWPVAGGEPTHWSDKLSIHGAALVAGDRVVASAGDTGELRFWEASTRKLITSLDLPGGRTNAVVTSPGGDWVVTAGNDRVPVVWNIAALPRLVDAVGHREAVNEVAIANDGTRFVTSSDDKTLRVWGLADGTQRTQISIDVLCAAPHVLADGRVIAGCEDKTIRRWDAMGHELGRVSTDVYLRRGSLSADDRLLAIGHMKGRVGLVDTSTGALIREVTAHDHQLYGVAFGPGGRVVTASLDNRVKVHETPGMTLIRAFQVDTEDGALAAAISPDGTLVAAASQDGSIDAWVLATGTRVAHAKLHAGAIWGVVFAPDGKTLYTAGDDGRLWSWDTTTWKVRDRLDPKEGGVSYMAVSPDGASAITVHRNSAIVVWDLATKRPRYRLGGNARDHGSCDDLSQQRWVDDAHRAIVLAACTAPPAGYYQRIQQLTKLRLDKIDVTSSF